FDSEYLLMQPVYSVQTWPGYAMIVALGIWLHIPAWIVSVIISAGVVGLFFLIVSDLMGRKWGFLAVLFLIAVDPFRHQSVSIGAFGASLLFGMLMIVAWLKWRICAKTKWGLLFGMAAGWGAITRPIDAICFALPICIAAVIESLRIAGQTKKLLAAALWALLVALPFLTIQLILDERITGHWY